MKEIKRKFLQAARSQTKSTKDSIKSFILEETRLNGEPFSLKNHEYQEMVIDLHLDPDVNFVCSKVAQTGISEVIYRIKLAYAYLVPGYFSALILPSLGQVTEVMKTRIASIINESKALREMVDPKIDSASLKRLLNNSILYALSGSGTSKSTAITRPLRDITVDELARVDMKTVTSMTSRQKRQSHKSTSFFSTPIFAGYDISAEMELCGKVMEAILICEKCNHEFFPNFYNDVKIPSYSGALENLTVKKIAFDEIPIHKAFLECPKCKRKIPFGYPHTKWVDTAENKNLPKVGMKIGPFESPAFVQPVDLIKEMVTNTDKNEFEQQALGIPTSYKDSSLDITQIRFENEPSGILNVMGVDVGKWVWVTVGTVVESQLYIHTLRRVALKDAREEIPKIHAEFRCVCGVMDLLPNQELSTSLTRTIPNFWCAIYKTYKTPRPELFSLTMRDDEAVGVIKQVTINMSPMFDHMAGLITDGMISFKSSEMDQTLINHMKVMRRIKDTKLTAELKANVYRWVKPGRLSDSSGGSSEDHFFHSTAYCTVAAKLLAKSQYQLALPISIESIRTEKRVK